MFQNSCNQLGRGSRSSPAFGRPVQIRGGTNEQAPIQIRSRLASKVAAWIGSPHFRSSDRCTSSSAPASCDYAAPSTSWLATSQGSGRQIWHQGWPDLEWWGLGSHSRWEREERDVFHSSRILFGPYFPSALISKQMCGPDGT